MKHKSYLGAVLPYGINLIFASINQKIFLTIFKVIITTQKYSHDQYVHHILCKTIFLFFIKIQFLLKS
jgi:hypothetical protein